MEKVTASLPQLILVVKEGRARYLERLTIEAGEPKADLTFQEDSSDSRIITIKYQIHGKETKGDILYYSEAFNQHAIVTFNIGYTYQGRVLAKNYNNQSLRVSLEHLSKEGGLRKKHIERINSMDDIKKDLTPEHVARKYRDFFYSLDKFS
jgi:hypothetical protein